MTTVSLKDKEMTCKDCKSVYVWTVREQTLFAERKYGEPIRCPACRIKKRQKLGDVGVSTSDASINDYVQCAASSLVNFFGDEVLEGIKRGLPQWLIYWLVVNAAHFGHVALAPEPATYLVKTVDRMIRRSYRGRDSK